MWGRPGKADKLQVNLKVRSLRQIKKFAKEPKCLRCGYDLRTQLEEGYGSCPECGQGCRIEDMADQIARQVWHRLPVMTDIAAGTLIIWSWPLMLLFIWVAVPSALTAKGLIMILGVPSPIVVSGVVWLGLFYGSVTLVYEYDQSFRDIRLWLWGLLLMSVCVVSISMVVAWIMLLAKELLYRIAEYQNHIGLGSGFTSAWQHMMLIGGVALFLGNRWWSTKFIITPCRRRCRELTLQYLAEPTAGRESMDGSQG